MPRLYCPGVRFQTGARISLDADTAQHVRVLRLAVGDAVTLFSGDGGEIMTTLDSISKNNVTVTLQAQQEIARESPLNITLVQALAVSDKMDWIVQKATELGVRCVVPMRCQRATLKLDQARAEKRVQHWRAIAIAACEQCGRNHVPDIAPVQSLQDVLAAPTLLAMLHPDADTPLLTWAKTHTAPSPGNAIGLLIGPEGGFAESEVAEALAKGVTPVRFGPRVLRTETAGIAALAALQATLGDLG